jgi:ElaB/YqjD/DUF883 family membrane-anchored ribosome-binding protein
MLNQDQDATGHPFADNRLADAPQWSMPFFIPGTPVYDATGEKLGTVCERQGGDEYLVVHTGRFFGHDVYVPKAAIRRSDEKGVYLTVDKDGLKHLDKTPLPPPVSAAAPEVDAAREQDAREDVIDRAVTSSSSTSPTPEAGEPTAPPIAQNVTPRDPTQPPDEDGVDGEKDRYKNAMNAAPIVGAIGATDAMNAEQEVDQMDAEAIQGADTSIEPAENANEMVGDETHGEQESETWNTHVRQQAGQAVDAVREQISPVLDQVRDHVGPIADRVKEQVSNQVQDQMVHASTGLDSVAGAVNSVGDTLRDNNLGQLSELTDKAAAEIEKLAARLRTLTPDEMVHELEEFSKKQPLIFLAVAAAIGLLGVRVIRAGAHTSEQ